MCYNDNLPPTQLTRLYTRLNLWWWVISGFIFVKLVFYTCAGFLILNKCFWKCLQNEIYKPNRLLNLNSYLKKFFILFWYTYQINAFEYVSVSICHWLKCTFNHYQSSNLTLMCTPLYVYTKPFLTPCPHINLWSVHIQTQNSEHFKQPSYSISNAEVYVHPSYSFYSLLSTSF